MFRDLCALGRLNVPTVPELNRVAAEAAPCVLLTPLDCYWEGSLLQEPDEPVLPVNTSNCSMNSPSGYVNDSDIPANITWGNVNFVILRQCLNASAESGYTAFVDGVRVLIVLLGFVGISLKH